MPFYFRFFRVFRGSISGSFVQKVRLGQACALLADPRLSIKQAAARLGFRRESCFTHWLRRHTRHSPNGHRRTATAGRSAGSIGRKRKCAGRKNGGL